MGSVGNQNPWSPYNNYGDCSQGICSIYCPQFCYFFFPPPPPSNDDSTPFSPLIIAIIGVLASAFILVSYYTIVTTYCKRRNNNNNNNNTNVDQNEEIHVARDQWQNGHLSGLDESLIKTIAVCKYRKGDGLIEGTECAVCLSEFQENECLRLLPKCSHAFHLPCIDTWLKSHSNCPLCRANVLALDDQDSIGLNVNSNESHQPGDDLVLVVNDDDQESRNNVCDGEQVVLSSISANNDDDNENENVGSEVKRFRRSVSLGTFPFQRHLLISDVVKIEENIDEDLLLRVEKGIGSSKGFHKSSVAMKRSVSAGGLVCTVHGRGKNKSILPD